MLQFNELIENEVYFVNCSNNKYLFSHNSKATEERTLIGHRFITFSTDNKSGNYQNAGGGWSKLAMMELRKATSLETKWFRDCEEANASLAIPKEEIINDYNIY